MLQAVSGLQSSASLSTISADDMVIHPERVASEYTRVGPDGNAYTTIVHEGGNIEYTLGTDSTGPNGYIGTDGNFHFANEISNYTLAPWERSVDAQETSPGFAAQESDDNVAAFYEFARALSRITGAGGDRYAQNETPAMARARNISEWSANASQLVFAFAGAVEATAPDESLPNAASTARGVASEGIRNQIPLTSQQQSMLTEAWQSLGQNTGDLEFWSGTRGSLYSDLMDKVVVGPNILPNPAMAETALERLTVNAALAHEAGHMITSRAGLAFEGASVLDEFQASIVGRQISGLTSVECYQLLRAAVEKCKRQDRTDAHYWSKLEGEL